MNLEVVALDVRPDELDGLGPRQLRGAADELPQLGRDRLGLGDPARGPLLPRPRPRPLPLGLPDPLGRRLRPHRHGRPRRATHHPHRNHRQRSPTQRDGAREELAGADGRRRRHRRSAEPLGFIRVVFWG